MENVMKIKTGVGATTISLITPIGIWSISALNALPGLAVSPILGQLTHIFPSSSELDIQMLTSLPSLMIIPFVLIAGRLTEKVNNMVLLRVGLGIFLLSGILYFLSDRMWQLIVVSAILGIGSGMIVPLSTGLISHFFVGDERLKQFGYSSAITNLTLVIATVVTGYLAEVNWRWPFVVYLLPAISLVLSVFLAKSMKNDKDAGSTSMLVSADRNTESTVKTKSGFMVGNLIETMILYGLGTYLNLVVVYNLPFLMEEHHFTSGNAGTMISLFFLAIMLPGLILKPIVAKLKDTTLFFSYLSMAIGLGLILIAPTEWLIAPGCILAGLGYGVIQPWVYEKATHMAVPKKVTMALAYIMAMNYIAILLCPFIISFFAGLLGFSSQEFPFAFNMIITIAVAVYAWMRQKSFVFSSWETKNVSS